MTTASKNGVTSLDYTSSNIVALYNSASVNNVNEAVTVIFHAFLLENEFFAKDVPKEDRYCCMPEKWNSNAAFKIRYVHQCCPAFTCCVTWVPLYSNVSVHGIVCDANCLESVDLKISLKNYLKQKKNFSDIFEVFCNLDELSKHFNDNFCLPLLNLLHETNGKSRLRGLPGLVDELKTEILQILPVVDVLSMAVVNKSFNYLANSPFLWKFLFLRDFGKGGVPDIPSSSSSETNWKLLYKKEYLKKNRKAETRPYRCPRYALPSSPILNVDPDFFDTDIGIYFDPPFPDVYPPFFTPRLPPLFRRCNSYM